MDHLIPSAMTLMDRAHRLLELAGDDDLAQRLHAVIEHGRATRPEASASTLAPELAALVEAIPLSPED